jgi:hypothetical protein
MAKGNAAFSARLVQIVSRGDYHKPGFKYVKDSLEFPARLMLEM